MSSREQHAEEEDSIGQAVQDRIEELGTTAAAVARAADVDGNTVRAIIRGGRVPVRANRVRIELALGWPPGTFDRIDRGVPLDGPFAGLTDHDILIEQLRRLHERARRAGE